MQKHPLYLKAASGGYLAPKDLATLIRDALKRAFPTTKFTVRSSRGGGSSVDIGWMDGPICEAVSRIANAFKTKGFDGMIDLEHRNSLWLYPDGSAHVAHDSGTTGSLGCHVEIIESPKSGDAVLVESVASCYVFCSRSITPRAYHRAIAE